MFVGLQPGRDQPLGSYLPLVACLVACRPCFPRSRLSGMAPDSSWGLRRQATSDKRQDKDGKNRPPGGDPSAPRLARLRDRGGNRARTRAFQRGALQVGGLGDCRFPTAPPRWWNDVVMSRTQGFTSWLKTHAKDQSAIGDLARDVAADPAWPSRRQLSGQREYLEERGAIPAAVETLERAWELYEAQQER